MKRRTARENAFILIFESMFLDLNACDLIENNKQTDNVKLNDYAEKLVFGVFEKRDYILRKIDLFLKNWKLDRVSEVLLAILEISFYEILFVDDVDLPVSINEAVELAKKYFGGDGPAFVNGILGNFVKSVQT